MITKQNLGQEVVDLVSGMTGVVTSWHVNFSGVDQVGITPLSKDGANPAESLVFDIPQVELVGGRKHSFTAAAPHQFALGDEVKDIVTGFIGKVVEISIFLNGCVYATVQPPSEKNKFPDRIALPIARLEIKKKAKVEPERSPRGGPARFLTRRG